MVRQNDDVLSQPTPALTIAAADLVDLTVVHVDSHLRAGAFRTDSEIAGASDTQRTLVRWDAQGEDAELLDDLEADVEWDQFAVNERLYGLRTDYDETIYTTQIDTSDPQYSARLARAERLAREIESAVSSNPHIKEERGQRVDLSEEDLYSGVQRDKYVAPARRGGAKPKPKPDASPVARRTSQESSPRLAARFQGAGSTSPGTKRRHSPQSVNALGLEATAPRMSGKVIEEFLNFAESTKDHKDSKQSEISTYRQFSKDIDRRKGSPVTARAGEPAKDVPSSPAAEAKADTKPSSGLKLNPNAPSFTLNANAKAFTPGALSDTFVPAPLPAARAAPVTSPQHLPQPPISLLFPIDRRPPPIDLTVKVSEHYNRARRSADEAGSGSAAPVWGSGGASWRTYAPAPWRSAYPPAAPAYAPFYPGYGVVPYFPRYPYAPRYYGAQS